jgi:hypothetical protein
MKIIFILFTLWAMLLLPNIVSADCADLKNFTNWIRADEHTIVFYMENTPLASLNIPYCDILPSSSVRLLKSYVCDLDSIMVDGEECSIMTVEVLY